MSLSQYKATLLHRYNYFGIIARTLGNLTVGLECDKKCSPKIKALYKFTDLVSSFFGRSICRKEEDLSDSD